MARTLARRDSEGQPGVNSRESQPVRFALPRGRTGDRPQPGTRAGSAGRWVAAVLLAVTTLLAGCGRKEEDGIAKSPLGSVPAEPQRPGNPEAGRDALLNRAVATCGLPYSAYRARAGKPDPKLLLPGRTGRNAELPYMFTAYRSPSGVDLVTSNCLGCHAARLNGELVIGLGNEVLDFTDDPIAAVEGAGAFVKGKSATAQWRRWAGRVDTVSPYMITDTIGVNPGRNLTLALLAHRDPKTLAWSEKPLLTPPPETPLPVSVPAWWNMRKKHAMFYSAEGRGDHARLMLLTAVICTDTVAEAAAIDAWLPDVRAYIESLGPPNYPFPIDPGLAAQGRKVFAAKCARCHGSYGDDAAYPNRVIGLSRIGTDPALATAAYKDSDRFIRWYNQSFFGKISRVAPALGYIAPPLDGVWATAPYLHNGSVPTIRLLLESKKRPTYWRLAAETPAFDRQEIGWRYRTVPYGKAGAMSWDQRNRIYDTTLPGYSNRGHTFGDELTEADRSALLEYLKTL